MVMSPGEVPSRDLRESLRRDIFRKRLANHLRPKRWMQLGSGAQVDPGPRGKRPEGGFETHAYRFQERVSPPLTGMGTLILSVVCA